MTEPVAFFTTPIWHYRDNKLPEGIYDWCLEYKRDHPSDSQISNRGGYQSQVTEDYTDFVYLDYLKEQVKSLPKFNFGSWWININEKGDYNIQHTHPLTDLALIWYITDNNSSLVLTNPLGFSRPNIHEIYPREHNAVIFNCKAGDIVVFPSDVPHHVEQHTENTPRISISMNLDIPY